MSPFERCQSDIHARLSADSYFADISVILWRPRADTTAMMLVNQWNEALKGMLVKADKYGAAVIVELPVAEVEEETPGPTFVLRPVLRIFERPEINMGASGTGKSAESIALRILQLLHRYAPGQIDDSAAVGNFTRGRIEQTPVDEEQTLALTVRFQANAGAMPLASCVQPVIASASLTVTLTTATSGASLLYSTDGSYPSTAYSAPFVVSSGALVRAVATKSGLIASPLAWKVIT